MCPSFIGILDIQSWWEVPSIAHFCSLFRTAFKLLDFDIEELEEALLTDGTEECASSLLTELLVRLLRGCLGNDDISASNYQMFLRRLFRRKCQETGHCNIFNADIDFQFLPLRRKVQILQALCDFRLAGVDVYDSLKNLEAESLRVEPLGWDDNASAYWYFYGTRLYREDFAFKFKGKKRKHNFEREFRRHADILRIQGKSDRIWQVICFTEADWNHLTEKFKSAKSRVEQDLYTSLSENFLPEIPRLFQEKERLRRKRLLESMPRRTSNRVQSKKQKEEEELKSVKDGDDSSSNDKQKRDLGNSNREQRVRLRELKRSQSGSSRSENSRSPSQEPTMQITLKKKNKRPVRVSNVRESAEDMMKAKPSGRQTNNSLACATGQILIPDQKEQPHSTRKKVKSSQIFGLLQEDVQTDMYKVMKQLKAHQDAWPFIDAVEEDFAPNYYSVIRRPMDLHRMEVRLDHGYYTRFSMFRSDFNLIVKNCRLYNGQDNEYTGMVGNLETAFIRLTEHLFDCFSSSDEEIAIEYPIRSPPKRQIPKSEKNKSVIESKRRKCESSVDDNDDENDDDDEDDKEDGENDKFKSKDNKRPSTSNHFQKSSQGKSFEIEKSKNTSHDSDSEFSDLSHSDLPLSSKNKKDDVDKADKLISRKKKKKMKNIKDSKKKHKARHGSKKNKEKRKHSKHISKKLKKKKTSRQSSTESSGLENESCSPVDEPKESSFSNQSETFVDAIFYKDKYDKIKERRRGASKTNFENVCETSKTKEKHKSNPSTAEKIKNTKLKETIDKLKAKSEKGQGPVMFNEYFVRSQKRKKKFNNSGAVVKQKYQHKTKSDEYEFVDDLDSNDSKVETQNKANQRKPKNKAAGSQLADSKNESATEALEQAVKDISKWLGDTPKLSEFSSNSNSPSQISEEYGAAGTKPDDDPTNQLDKEKNPNQKKDGIRRKLITKDFNPRVVLSRKKELQRTIERLQPGKAKGNLIFNVQSLMKQDDLATSNTIVKGKETRSSVLVKTDEVESPKLSLGTVLDSVGFGIENQHNFTNETSADRTNKVKVVDTGTMTCDIEETEVVEKDDPPTKTPETEPPIIEPEPLSDLSLNPSQEKATPNLSAWFKAFGAPKGGTSKKKSDELDPDDSKSNDQQFDAKNTVISDGSKVEHLPTEEAMNSEGGESPIPSMMTGSRPRRTSTGSSVSERSSFSQDLDSPRHQPCQLSPLLRSPASPRIEDHQKNLYLPVNGGTLRVGFYQDTASAKSSPEKSCSPREAPQSPYAAYSQHVYAISSNAAQLASQTPNNFNESSSKSPLPTYGQNYYEASKIVGKRHQEDYSYNSESLYKQPASPLAAPFSPAHSTYSQHSQHSPYSHSQNSPQTYTQYSGGNVALQNFDSKLSEKSSIFPVKKRTYNEQHIVHTNSFVPTTSKLILECNENKRSSKVNSSLTASPYNSNKGLVMNDPNYLHSNATSVIMSSGNGNLKSQYPNCQPIPIESPIRVDYSPSKSADDSTMKSLRANKEQVSSVKDQYPDMSTIQHSITRKQYDFAPMNSLSKPYADKTSDFTKQSHVGLDLKTPSYSNCTDLSINKSPEIVNIDYSNKTMENLSKSTNPDVNLSYLSTENMNQSKLDSINSLINKSHRGCDIYNMMTSFGGIIDMNTNQNHLKNAIDSVESNPRYTIDKLNADQQYQNSLDPIQCIANNLTNDSMKKSRSDTMSKVSYPEAQVGLNLKSKNISDWKSDGRSNEPQFYHGMNNSDTIGVKKMNADLISSNYELNLSGPNESLAKMTELRVPMCSVADMSSHKIDRQLMSQAEFAPRNKNPMPLHTPKPVEVIYNHNSSLNPTNNTYRSSNPHSTLSMEPTLRNLSTLPQLMDRYKEEALLSGYQASNPSYDKNIPLAHLYPKNVHGTIHSANNPSQMFPAPISMTPLYLSNIQPNMHNLATMEPLVQEKEKKSRPRKKKNTVEPLPCVGVNQSYHSYGVPKPPQSKTDAIMSGNIVPGSAFNYGPPVGVTIAGRAGMFPEGSSFLDDMRNPAANPYMTANYIAAAAAAHQRSAPDPKKCPKSDHSQVVHVPTNPYRFLSHEVQAGYPFLGMNPSSPIYQQFLQGQQGLYRHPGTQMMGMFPTGYPSALGVRQPYDTLNRPPW
ncbi:uncharacterized protein LOC143922871 isoform X2 [Arctopsyche grandis]|uniref:uncharacterized protein LOC143922871 isoform X2 n=2 Tax=Arctopsyche grandis TaxID=121162 RepID=UPI00406D7576